MDVPVESKREIDPRLESIVNRMFQRCLEDGQYKQALGLALETRRMDIFERSILESVSHLVFIAACIKLINACTKSRKRIKSGK